MRKVLLVALGVALLAGCGADAETTAKPKYGPPTPIRAQALVAKGFTPWQAKRLARNIECGRAASAVVRNGAATPFSPRFLKFATTCDRWATTRRMSNDGRFSLALPRRHSGADGRHSYRKRNALDAAEAKEESLQLQVALVWLQGERSGPDAVLRDD